MILDKDRETITVFNPKSGKEISLKYPGKSSFIHNEECGCKIDAQGIIRRNTEMVPDRRDHLFVATIGQIEDAGWQVWWAPLQLRGLAMHCRIIPEVTIMEKRDPAIEEASRLAKIFIKQY